MRRIAVTAATFAATVGLLLTAAPAQADDAGTTPSDTGTTVIHHRFQLHFLDHSAHDHAPRMAPRKTTLSVRQAHRPG